MDVLQRSGRSKSDKIAEIKVVDAQNNLRLGLGASARLKKELRVRDLVTHRSDHERCHAVLPKYHS